MDKGFGRNTPVDVVIRPEDIEITAPSDEFLCGTVTAVTFKGVHYEMLVECFGKAWRVHSTDFSPAGSEIGLRITPEDIHIMKKSAYSGMFGDYSSYSEEFDEMGDPEVDLTEESVEEES